MGLALAGQRVVEGRVPDVVIGSGVAAVEAPRLDRPWAWSFQSSCSYSIPGGTRRAGWRLAFASTGALADVLGLAGRLGWGEMTSRVKGGAR